MPKPHTEMTASDVIKLYTRLLDAGVDVWVDGGWDVDALLGEQRRKHGDLDIVVESKHEPELQSICRSLGYRDKPRNDTRAWNYVLADDMGHEVDVHVITLDKQGNGIYGPSENGDMYPASSLTGVGTIGGQRVKCIAAEDVVKFHAGYEIDETDYHDVSALCAKFGLELPEEYSRFTK